MIDPKLNELSPEPAGSRAATREGSLSEAQQAERLRRSRAGLSISDTVAGESNLSVGGKGVDTSGVEAGAGAGAGSTYTTPQAAGSPAPSIVPGGSGSGTTPRSDSGLSQNPGTTRDTLTGSTGAPSSSHRPQHHEVAARAYQCWHERGCPEGSPEVDWDRAEKELRHEHTRGGKASGAGA